MIFEIGSSGDRRGTQLGVSGGCTERSSLILRQIAPGRIRPVLIRKLSGTHSQPSISVVCKWSKFVDPFVPSGKEFFRPLFGVLPPFFCKSLKIEIDGGFR
jgi:hypothetical protein